MKIRQATLTDLTRLLDIFEAGKTALRAANNYVQWQNGYPNREVIQHDIESGSSFVCVVDHADETNLPVDTIIATFYIQRGNNPVFTRVAANQWINQDEYVTLQRLCSSGKVKGAGVFCLKWATEHYPNLRIYTHESNTYMTKIIKKCHFIYCGQALLVDDIPRDLYQFGHVTTDTYGNFVQTNERSDVL